MTICHGAYIDIYTSNKDQLMNLLVPYPIHLRHFLIKSINKNIILSFPVLSVSKNETTDDI